MADYTANSIRPMRNFGVMGRAVSKNYPRAFVSVFASDYASHYLQGFSMAGILNEPAMQTSPHFIDWSAREGNAGRSGYIPGDMGWYLLGHASQETRAEALQANGALGAMGVIAGAVRQERRLDTMSKLEQHLDNINQYDPGRVQAEIAELRARFPDRPGMETRELQENAPTITIRNAEGRILLEGKANSVEELIGKKMSEAANSTDPAKRTLNLAGADLSQGLDGKPLNFKGFNFQNIDLRGANLGGAQFTDCQFKDVDMRGVNLKGSTFNLCHMENVNMAGFVGDDKTRFSNSSMYNVDMSYAEAPQIKFENIRAEYLQMQGANFAGATINKMEVENLWAPQVNLEGASIGGLKVTGQYSSLEGAKMNGAQIGQSVFGTREHPINMKSIEAKNSSWTDTVFHADLSRGDFTGASFTRVDMRNASTPEGPMIVQDANMTGLIAGEAVKMKASAFVYDGIKMRIKDNQQVVFNGTAPMEKAHSTAIAMGLNHIELSPNGDDFDVSPADRRPQFSQPKPTVAPMFQPPSPYKKKGSGTF